MSQHSPMYLVRIVGLIVALCLSFPATAALAADDAAASFEAKKAAWVKEYEGLKARHAKLEAELTEARVDLSRGRSRNRLRGDGKQGLLVEIDRLEREFTEADSTLRDFPETARRAGALPGWFRDTAPAAQAQTGEQASDTVAPRASGSFGSGRSHNISRRPARSDDASAEQDNDDDAGRRSLSDRRAKDRESRRLGR